MKKINKISLLLILITIIFFVGINSVKADVQCEYVSPFAKISHDGSYTIGMNLQVTNLINRGYGTTFVGLRGLALQTGSVEDGQYGYSMSVELENTTEIYYKKNNDDKYSIDRLYFPVTYGKSLETCPDYIRFVNENEGNNKYVEAKSGEYKNYIQKQQYASISGKSVTFTSELSPDSFKNTLYVYPSGFYSLLTENPVFVNKNLSYSFKDNAKNKKTNLDILKEKIKEYGKEGIWEEIQPNMDKVLNTHENDKRSHSPAFCNATHERVYSYIKSDLENNSGNVNAAGKNNLKNWLYYCGRYLFEDQIEGMNGTKGVEKFSKYYKFLYGDSSDPTKVEKMSEYTQEQYSAVVDGLDAMVGIKETSNKEEMFKSNTCYVFCKSCIKGEKNYNGNACSACTSSSNDYKKCHSCVYGNKKCYSGLGESDMKSCLTGCMGEETYNSYINQKSKYEEQLAKEYKENVDKLTYSFKSADLLTFKYGLKKYKPKCKDVTFLTSIWSVIIVLAPFLLIIYTAFDYFKVVMAGDEEKMKVSKKKIPKRIIALVILLVFPAILKMLVTTFGTHGSENTKYIRCILSRDYGENEEDDEDEKKQEEDSDTKENNKE